MQHIMTLTCLVVEESDLNWPAAQPNTHNVQVAELNQAVKSENLAKAATNLVINSIQHICKKVDAT
jgi:acetamidase/formamidase